MKLLIIFTALAISGVCHADVPKLLTEPAFTSASLAEAANHFIAIGEQATFKELEEFLAHDSTSTNYRVKRGYNVDERIAWIFRMIYEPKEPIPMRVAKTGAWIPGSIIPLRAPNFGSLGIPQDSMPAEKWPLYPLALSGSTYIVLKEKYNPIDATENINHYMEYCKESGAFRKTQLVVPTREQGLKDSEQLKQTAAWKAIKWVNNGEIGFPMGEQRTSNFIQAQASNIPQSTIAKKQPEATLTRLSAR